MNERIQEEIFPIFILELDKKETAAATLDAVVSHFQTAIEEHPWARFIDIFDHYAHTQSLADGEIAQEIRGAKNIVFCFGMSIPNPYVLATRPRSIGVAELDDRFIITFLEAPMPVANNAMERWARSLMSETKGCSRL